MRAYELVDSQAYHTGFQLWLKSQGVKHWQLDIQKH